MGDMSHEPSMEEILSSIKKIISEDATKPLTVPRGRRVVAPEPEIDANEDIDVLELTEAVQEAEAAPEMAEYREKPTASESAQIAAPQAQAKQKTMALPPHDRIAPLEEAIVSETSVAASRSAFAQIAAAKPKDVEPVGDPLYALVGEMLRPMLKEWLDANLPRVVEKMVAKEIARLRDD